MIKVMLAYIVREEQERVQGSSPGKDHDWTLKSILCECKLFLIFLPDRDRKKYNYQVKSHILGLPWWLSGEESACKCRRHKFDPWVGKIPWRRKRQPILVFLPGKSHGHRSLVGYSPWGTESDTT